MLGASRMSSVFGLNASPRSATRLPRSEPRCFDELVDDAPLLELVHLDDRVQELEVVARVRRELLQRERVLREAAAAVADSGAQEMRAEAVVEADPLGDLDDVGAGRFADVRDLVDEADARHEERVRGELDHLGGGDVGADDRCAERLVERSHRIGVRLREGADHDAVGVREVPDGRALGQKLRIGDVADVRESACVELALGSTPLSRPARCSS